MASTALDRAAQRRAAIAKRAAHRQPGGAVLSCPCGSGSEYEACCGPVISGAQPASSPEALMRARYSAYNKQEVDFLLSSLHPDGDGGADRQSTKDWAASADWHGLEILKTSGGAEGDELGAVEFVAKYSLKGEPQRHHESATFKRHQGRWLYLDGDQHKGSPVVGPRLRLGRNDSCPCDTGKKYKKCCLPQFESVAASPDQLVRARFSAALAGHGRFLERSLHPDAPQSASEPEAEPPREMELLATEEHEGTARVRVRVNASVASPEYPAQERLHHIKKLGERWLWLRQEVVSG